VSEATPESAALAWLSEDASAGVPGAQEILALWEEQARGEREEVGGVKQGQGAGPLLMPCRMCPVLLPVLALERCEVVRGRCTGRGQSLWPDREGISEKKFEQCKIAH